jgi:outer membrane protein assembly factor BamB
MDRKIVLMVISVVMSATVIPVIGLPPTEAGFTEYTQQIKYDPTGMSGPNDIWPMFRNDPGNTGSSEYYSPNTNHVIWKKQIKNEIGQITPILYANKVYISTGWYYKSFPPLTDIFNMTPPSPSEIIQKLLEEQSDTAPGLYCLNEKTGEELWNRSMDLPSNPAIVDNKLYMTAFNYSLYSGILYCLDAATGSISWSKSVPGLILSPTIVSNGKIFLGVIDMSSYSGSMKCYDLSGTLLWDRLLHYHRFIFLL